MITSKSVETKIENANNFRKFLLSMNDNVHLSNFKEKTEFLDFVYKNSTYLIKDENQLDLCYRLLRRNLKNDFALDFWVINDIVKIQSLPGIDENNWRQYCAISQQNKEIKYFGASDIDINIWYPEGYNCV